MATEPTNALATIETLNPIAVFQTQGGVEDILSKLERDVRSIQTDATTEKGRKEIKSLAYKVARSKTALDDMGKAVAEDARKTVESVNASRRTINARLDALRDEVRKPVDDYEAREQARVDGIRDQISKIELLGQRLDGLDIETLKASVEEADRLKAYDFQEFASRADLAVQQTANALKAAIIIAEKAEADRIEAERLAAIKAEEERLAAIEVQKVREAEIARAAAEQARKDAEEKADRERKAAAEALELERMAKEEAAKSNEHKRVEGHQRAIRWINGMTSDAVSPFNDAALIRHISSVFEGMEEISRDYEEFQAQADDAISAGRKAIAERLAYMEAKEKEAALKAANEAEEKAKRDQAAAIENERKRVADEKAAREAEEKRRAADKAHRATINREVLADLISAGLTDEHARQAISAIVGRKVRHVTLSY